MLHLVEIRLDENGIAPTLTRMQAWLDRQGSQPKSFRYSFAGPDTVLHVDFELLADAEAFARAFGGIVLP